MILRGSPDPTDIPPDAGRFRGCGSEMHLFHEAPLRVSDDQARRRIRPDKRPNGPGRQFASMVIGMTLPPILQPDCEQQRHTLECALRDQSTHLDSGRVQAEAGRIAADRWSTGHASLAYLLLPTAETGMHRGDRPQPVIALNCFVQPGISGGGITPENAGKVTDPGLVDCYSVHG